MPSSLGSRLILVVRQADKNLALSKIFKIRQHQFKAHLGCLNVFMVLIASYQ